MYKEEVSGAIYQLAQFCMLISKTPSYSIDAAFGMPMTPL
jgi:hypothetical protein